MRKHLLNLSKYYALGMPDVWMKKKMYGTLN